MERVFLGTFIVHFVKYPYVRGVLWSMWQEELQNNESPLDAWKSIVENPEKVRKYKQARGKGDSFVRIGMKCYNSFQLHYYIQ